MEGAFAIGDLDNPTPGVLPTLRVRRHLYPSNITTDEGIGLFLLGFKVMQTNHQNEKTS
jgi:hypothetical protein